MAQNAPKNKSITRISLMSSYIRFKGQVNNFSSILSGEQAMHLGLGEHQGPVDEPLFFPKRGNADVRGSRQEIKGTKFGVAREK